MYLSGNFTVVAKNKILLCKMFCTMLCAFLCNFSSKSLLMCDVHSSVFLGELWFVQCT